MELVERLMQHKTLGSAPRMELEWLAEHGVLRSLKVGDVLSHKGQPVAGMYAVLSGRLAIFVDRGSGPQKMTEWRAGDVTGTLPYSRLVKPPGTVIVEEPTEILALGRECLPEMTRVCLEVTTLLVHLMLDRARLFTTNDLQNEKMISLGKLSAGLAHELGNPTAAIERSVCLLTDRLEDAENAARALEAVRLTDEQLTAVDAIRKACLAKKSLKERSSLEQVDREDAIADWLAERGLDTANAPMLAETEVTFDSLNALAVVVTGQALNAVLRWSAAGCAVRNLASEIQGASMRISSLVTAVKGFTHMDQAMVAELVDPRPGINSALTVLNAKAKGKSVTVTTDLEEDLPRVFGFAAELNQIWGNLLDNALDAAPEGGLVNVSARSERERVVVRVIDGGPGVPEEIRSRIFDPFFTTKPMGQGTGLGLDIAQRLARHNDGVIEFESKPGRTEFRVSLPVAGA